jgi:hypothetical protein
VRRGHEKQKGGPFPNDDSLTLAACGGRPDVSRWRALCLSFDLFRVLQILKYTEELISVLYIKPYAGITNMGYV